MYNDFYKSIDQKYVAGFKQFFTYVPEQDRELMNRYAKGEYGQKFNQIYNQYQDSIKDYRDKDQITGVGAQEKDSITGGSLMGGEIDQNALNENTDFTKVTPEQRKMAEDCLNVSPEEAVNVRNEELLAGRELFTGGDRDMQELQAYQSMRMKHHIQMSDDFISSYLNGGQCYTIDQAPDQEIMQQNRQKMNYQSKRKYINGGFGDTNVQPVIQDNTLTIPYHQDTIQTTTGSQVPSQVVDNGNTNMQEQQTAEQQMQQNAEQNASQNQNASVQGGNTDLSGGKRRKGGNEEQQQEQQQNEQQEPEQSSSSSTSVDSSSIDNEDDEEELFGGDEDNNDDEDNEGFIFT